MYLACMRHRSRDLLIRAAQVPVGLLDCVASLRHQRHQVDDENPIDGEQQRLEDRLKKRISGMHKKRVGRERSAEQHRANSRPDTRKKVGYKYGGEEPNEWRTCTGQRNKPYPDNISCRYHGYSEKIANCTLVELHNEPDSDTTGRQAGRPW